MVSAPHDAHFLEGDDGTLAVCGDGFGGAGIEAAVASAQALAAISSWSSVMMGGYYDTHVGVTLARPLVIPRYRVDAEMTWPNVWPQ